MIPGTTSISHTCRCSAVLETTTWNKKGSLYVPLHTPRTLPATYARKNGTCKYGERFVMDEKLYFSFNRARVAA